MEMSSEVSTRLQLPNLYLVIVNITKQSNVRALLLTATAFGCQAVLVVGQEKNLLTENLPIPFQNQVKAGRIALLRFVKWVHCVDYLIEHNISLVGVEIDETALILDDDYFTHRPFYQDTAILMGNEGQGIHPKHMQACDAICRIPQYGVGTASLNVNVAASLVLYRFSEEKRKMRERHRKRS